MESNHHPFREPPASNWPMRHAYGPSKFLPKLFGFSFLNIFKAPSALRIAAILILRRRVLLKVGDLRLNLFFRPNTVILPAILHLDVPSTLTHDQVLFGLEHRSSTNTFDLKTHSVNFLNTISLHHRAKTKRVIITPRQTPPAIRAKAMPDSIQTWQRG